MFNLIAVKHGERRMRGVLFFLVLLFSGDALAKTVVLIHGFASGPGGWYKHHVVQAFMAQGYADGGVLPQAPHWRATQAPNVVYAVKLPWWAPLEVQGRLLDRLLKPIYRQRREPMILVGHSSGGIVARLYSIAPSALRVPVAGVVTIASPNLGTPFARVAWRMLDTPMGRMLKEMDDKSERLYAARRLLWQISTDKTAPIHWLNRMPHPKDVRYVSLVHTRKLDLRRGDFGLVVPPKYQDLRRVPALYGRAQSIPIRVGHKLHWQDGVVLARMLHQL